MACLDCTEKRVLMFGGKGGVGKTTASAATALHYALAGQRSLIVSSDLAPSLSDIFETEIGPTEKRVPGVEGLCALEIGPGEVMRRWKEKFGPEVYQAVSALVDLPYDEVVDYVAMAPGIQEEFMLDYILERIRDDCYDKVIWDTAPAGATLRLLGLPQRFIEHLRVAPKVYLEVQHAFNLSQTPFLNVIESWGELAHHVVCFFSDPANIEFVLVTIPEALGVYQSKRVVEDLEQHGLTIRYMIINGVIANADCDFLRQRQEMQRPYVGLLEDAYGERMTMLKVPFLPYEVRGIERLSEVSEFLFCGGG